MVEKQGTKLCKHCKMEIPAGAKVCPQCRKGQGDVLKWVIICIVAFGIIGASVNNKENRNKETEGNSYVGGESDQKIDDSDKYISITSTELIDAFKENEVKCKQNYDGKLLMVTGKIESLGTDVMGNTYVSLGHDSEYTFTGIMCYTKDNAIINQIAELKKGDIITVSGKGDCGSLSFSLKNIKIEEDKKETHDEK